MVVNFYPTTKQLEALNYLYDQKTEEIMFGGGACFEKDTLIRTSQGYKNIQDITIGDSVLSYDELKDCLIFSKVLETFKYTKCHLQLNKRVEVKFKDGTTIRCTENHKFLFRQRWITISEIARGNMDLCKEFKEKVSYKQQRKTSDKKLVKFSTNSSNEACSRSKEETPSKSQRWEQEQQHCKKSGMGNPKRKLLACCEKWSLRQDDRSQKGFRKISEGFQRGSKCNKQAYRKSSQRYKDEIQTKKIYSKDSCKRIWNKRINNKGCGIKKKLEAREINLEEIDYINFIEDFSPVYDLKVDKTHTYIITKKNLIVHNSGGKSVLGCFWIISSCLKYPMSRYLLGRAVLKNLKQTTVKTLFRLMGNSYQKIGNLNPEVRFGLKKDRDYNYNRQDGEITFINGSEIVFKDLKQEPSDPDFDSLGSTEYTGAFIDEVSQITAKAKDVVATRQRHMTREYNILGKSLYCTNPCKGWPYQEFYKPSKEGKITEDRVFIQALAKDNIYTDPNYIPKLMKRHPITKERLLFGNWEYDDDPAKMFDYDDIMDLFTNTPEDMKNKYLTVDVARKGKDLTTIFYWEGLLVRGMWAYQYKTQIKRMTGIKTIFGPPTTETIKIIEDFAKRFNVRRSRIIIDEDGVGGGVVDGLPGCRGFINNSSAIIQGSKPNNYASLKAQCFFMLAEHAKNGTIGVRTTNEEFKEALIEELEHIKQKDIDNDGKLAIMNKEYIKKIIGRSSDFADALMMRMLGELNPGRIAILQDKDNVTGLY